MDLNGTGAVGSLGPAPFHAGLSRTGCGVQPRHGGSKVEISGKSPCDISRNGELGWIRTIGHRIKSAMLYR